jgi:hypothetical protein
VVLGQTQVLETALDLSTPTWSAVGAPVTVADGVNKVVLPASLAQQFFRIRAINW